jgi:AcrR family transcriptional regulator
MEHVAALLWEPQVQPKRGPRPTLTLGAIARAGIAIADAEGLAAVTMQRVAESAGVTKMALYRYVPGKAELVALMIDLGIGEPPAPAAKGVSWQETLDAWAQELFGRFCQHPWALEAAVGARVVGPNELGWLERAVAALTGSGLDGAEMLDVAVLLTGHVRNLAQQISAIDPAQPEKALAANMIALLRDRSDRFPALSAAMASATQHGNQDQALTFGINRILDGVSVLIASRQS